MSLAHPWRRAHYTTVADLDAAVACVEERGYRSAIVDVEPLVAAWDTDSRTLHDGIDRLLERLARPDSTLATVVFATNSRRRWTGLPRYAGLAVEYRHSAFKPVRVARYTQLGGPGVVVGDQIAIDGVLAWRLRYAFVHYTPMGRVPFGPAVMHGFGRALRDVLFERQAP